MAVDPDDLLRLTGQQNAVAAAGVTRARGSGRPSAANSYFIGDSIADGLRSAAKAPGNTKAGRNPAAVSAAIGSIDPGELKGRTIYLSTGVSNNPRAGASAIRSQIDALRQKGVDPGDIRIIGVGDRSDFAGLNDSLAGVARSSGAAFTGPLDPSNLRRNPNDSSDNGVHLKDWGKGLAAIGPQGIGPDRGIGPFGSSGGAGAPAPGPGSETAPAGGGGKPGINMAVPAAGRALLATIGSPGFESNGGYTQRYGQKDFTSFADHPRTAVPIQSGPNRGKVSDAAGKYQFISTTWDDQKRKTGVTDFSPQSQDLAAWNLAKENYAGATKGRDLSADLYDPKMLPTIAQALHPTWTSLPGGIESRTGLGQFSQAFQSNLQSETARGPGTHEPAFTAAYWQGAPGGSPTGVARSPASPDDLRQQMQMQALGIV